MGWRAEQMYFLGWEELAEAKEGRGVQKELKRARLIGKMVGFEKVGPSLVQGQRQQELDSKQVRD